MLTSSDFFPQLLLVDKNCSHTLFNAWISDLVLRYRSDPNYKLSPEVATFLESAEVSSDGTVIALMESSFYENAAFAKDVRERILNDLQPRSRVHMLEWINAYKKIDR